MPPAAYINREGEKITRQAWEKLRADQSYWLLREYENDTLHVTAMWLGEIANAKDAPPEHWKPYRLNVENIITHDDMGNPLPKQRRVRDPDASETFRTEREMLESYEDLLVRYAGCKWVPSPNKMGDGASPDHHFIEVGNKLAPPPPDMPTTKDLPRADIAFSW